MRKAMHESSESLVKDHKTNIYSDENTYLLSKGAEFYDACLTISLPRTRPLRPHVDLSQRSITSSMMSECQWFSLKISTELRWNESVARSLVCVARETSKQKINKTFGYAHAINEES